MFLISSSRNTRAATTGSRALASIASITALNRPLPYFFPNVTDVRALPTLSALLANKHGLKVAENFPRLKPRLQIWVADTVELLAKEQS